MGLGNPPEIPATKRPVPIPECTVNGVGGRRITGRIHPVNSETGTQSASRPSPEREAIMKTTKMLPAAVWAVFAFIVLAGCSSKPVDELKMAAIAMNDARNVDASEFAPKDWERAQAQYREANGLITMGRYSEARGVLIDSIASYNDAKDTAEHYVEDLQIQIKALQSSAETNLKKIEKGCENSNVKQSVRKRIEAALPRLDEKLSAIKAEVEARKYRTAHMNAQEVDFYMADLMKKLGIQK